MAWRLPIERLPEVLYAWEAVVHVDSHSTINGISYILRNIRYELGYRLKRIGALAPQLRCSIERISGHNACQQGIDGGAQPINVGACVGASAILLRCCITWRGMTHSSSSRFRVKFLGDAKIDQHGLIT